MKFEAPKVLLTYNRIILDVSFFWLLGYWVTGLQGYRVTWLLGYWVMLLSSYDVTKLPSYHVIELFY